MSVTHFPSDHCPRCHASIFERGVHLTECGHYYRGGWAVYDCRCGYRWRVYWPKVGEMIRKCKHALQRSL